MKNKEKEVEKIEWLNLPRDIPENIAYLNRIALLYSFIVLNTKEYDRETLKSTYSFQKYINRYQNICYNLKDTDDFKKHFILFQDGTKIVGEDFLITSDKKKLKSCRKKLIDVFRKYGNFKTHKLFDILNFISIPSFVLLALGFGALSFEETRNNSQWFFILFIIWVTYKILIKFPKMKILFFIPSQVCMNSFDEQFEEIEKLTKKKEDVVSTVSKIQLKENVNEIANEQNIDDKNKIEIKDKDDKKNKLLQIFDKHWEGSITAKEKLKKLCEKEIDFAITIYNFLNLNEDIKNKLNGEDVACFYAKLMLLFYPKQKGKEQCITEFCTMYNYTQSKSIGKGNFSVAYSKYKKKKDFFSTNYNLIMENISKN